MAYVECHKRKFNSSVVSCCRSEAIDARVGPDNLRELEQLIDAVQIAYTDSLVVLVCLE